MSRIQQQAASINKAINNQETQVKEKHVRSAIIGTYHERGATTFWTVVQLLPLQGNPIVCWKFCHTLHKILREGHPNVIPESRIHKSRLIELGKYWSHLRDSIGRLISCYCNLLANRLDFHSKNPKFPGNLQLNDEQLESIGEMDINNFFQISVEMFDYMEEILNLQSVVFSSLDSGRANSMTNAGQCRLAPLIPCIQDSSLIYDYLVKLLFKLHSSLPPDILIGHRDRFYKQFKVLQEFYKKACVLQYFKHLIQIPPLPEEPPNFLVKSDLSCHISPVVILPPQDDVGDNDSIDLSLVDTSSIPNLLDIETTNGSISLDLHSEKDQLIEHLRREIEELKFEIQHLKVEHQKVVGEFQQHQQQSASLETLIKDLQQQLLTKQQELDALQAMASKTAVNTSATEKLVEAEQRCKANEVKFNKMKDVYNKLREEHIVLLRAKADIEKQFQSAKQNSEEAEKTKSAAEEKLQAVLLEKEALNDILQQTTMQSAEQLAEMMQNKVTLKRRNLELEEHLQQMIVEKTIAEQHVHKNTIKAADQIALLTQSKAHLEQEKLTLEEELAATQHEKFNMEKMLQQSMSETSQKLDELDDENKEFDELLFQAVDEKYVVEQKLVSVSEEYEKQLADHIKERNELQIKVAEMESSLANVSYEKCTSELALLQNSEKQSQQINELVEERRFLKEKVGDLEEQLTEMSNNKVALQQTVSELQDKVNSMESKIRYSKKEADEEKQKMATDASGRQFAFLMACLEEAQNVIQNALEEIDNPMAATMSCPPEYLLTVCVPLTEELNKFWHQTKTYNETNKDLQHLLKSVARFAHYLGQLIIQGNATANMLPDIDDCNKLTVACRTSGKDALVLLSSLKKKESELQVLPHVKKLSSDITDVREMAKALIKSQAAKVEGQIGDLVEQELADMDRAIEEAANRIAQILAKSREAETGIKLEVSEKILDSCTALMQSIKVLVKRSKDMQQEILDQGRGSASAKEFYKRNHQWTEGLISAAKAVGIGAKFLVDAADKVVSGQAKFATLMAASQEIAASTAQLVVASKVKAAPGSENLHHLSKASSEVRGCTGNVVATVKDCAQMMEDNDVLDFVNLTLHQAKRLEMESQVRVLELESNLEKERIKLSTLRKKHYSMAGPGEGWEDENQAN